MLRYAVTKADSLTTLPQPAPALPLPRPSGHPTPAPGLPAFLRACHAARVPTGPDNSKRGQKRRARPGLPRGRAAGGRLQLTDPAIPQPGPRPAAPYLPLSAALLLWPRGWVNPGRRFLCGPFRQRRRASGPSSGLGGERRPSSRPAAIFPWRRGGGALPPPSWMRPHVCRTSRPIVCRTAGAILVVADERQRSAPPSSYGTGS